MSNESYILEVNANNKNILIEIEENSVDEIIEKGKS